MSESATDSLNVKIFSRISKTDAQNTSAEQQASPERSDMTQAPETSERMLESQCYPLKDKLIDFYNQDPVRKDVKNKKCKF